MIEAPRRLIADAMLGKLATWLRILGFDVAYERSITDQDLTFRARREGRVILTRDRRLVQRRWSGSIRFILIESDRMSEQLRQIVRRLGRPARRSLLTRCVRCNETLIPYHRDHAAARVPRYVHRTQKRFRRCPNCGRIYWPGTHPRRIRQLLRTLSSQGRGPMESSRAANKR